MTLLKVLDKRQIISIITITILVFSSLWIYEVFYHKLEERNKNELYEKLEQENKALIYEVKNLVKQNKTLIEVLKLKQKIE
jgi:ATP/ADP translocase